jgi:2-polyprenyl-3-methyl-5-hydroxy-6-metoxy-1,4-benzoquinol methylase
VKHLRRAHDVLPYGEGPNSALNFTPKCAQACVAAVARSGKRDKLRALDVGCAVGGATFELARGFDEVGPNMIS